MSLARPSTTRPAPSRSVARAVAAGAASLALGAGLFLTPAVAFAADPPPNIDQDGPGLIADPNPGAPQPGTDSGETEDIDLAREGISACGTVNPGCAAADGGLTALEGTIQNTG
ncbi:hypothetical protein [Pseudonocardia sp. HH130630-07]|uniref:hypothetical protein n=1 Tax=Pseudonocardia sp. HH130630-07 TaxID=1690815 RepID=UPI00081525A0|nr:hypothetical protein [Pseudonocardia sp. HH130630-07]ANY08364.1 hypothetical protein AFB00_21125 [Pseudonocardia sp. HH130630-07]